jgi:hypothetical protein
MWVHPSVAGVSWGGLVMGRFIGWILVIGICAGTGRLQSAAQEKKPDKVAFAGKWSGTWSNNLGQSGTETYEFAEDDQGRITGTEDYGVVMQLAGERLGKDTLRFEVERGATLHLFIGQVVGDELHLHYTAKSETQEWFGFCRQKRVK